ncbi:hypothetical protein EB796_023545 [Bugula neritina]|uniref:Uncharacterized protein n=1 Tax=Bugula neritina TaxID=10212 RepID=A0A7J7IWH9_BUGNE|nr:hypothetical protein EB796_023545 [Bugula neritina]
MTASTRSLNILGGNSGSSTKFKSSPLTKSNRLLEYKISMSPGSVSRSFDMADHQGRQIPKSLSFQSSEASPSLSVLSPFSLATPPPTFYEAVDLPSYLAPTPSEDGSLPSRPCIIFIGINVLAVPPRSRKTRRSVGSCEDLTDLVRNSLMLSPKEEQHEYANAMFNNELLQDFETSADHAQSRSAVTGEFDSTVTAEAHSLDTLNTVTTATDSTVYSLAGVLEDDENSSPRVTSTYLFDNNIPPAETHPLAESGSDLEPETEIEPPPVPTVPRPYAINTPPTSSSPTDQSSLTSLAISQSEASIVASHQSEISSFPSAKLRQIRADSVDAGRNLTDQKALNRPLPVPLQIPGSRETFSYEQVNYGGKESSRRTSTLRNDNGAYEQINNVRRETKLTESEPRVSQPTTIWHVTLDGEPIDNALPEEITTSCGEKEAEVECENLNNSVDQSRQMSYEDEDGYLWAALSPPNLVRLPLPPVATEDDSEDEKPNWSGIGSIRKIFNDFSKKRLRRTKSTDILSVDTASPTPSNSKTGYHESRASKASSKKKKSSKTSSTKVSDEFSFIRTTDHTKSFTKSGSQSKIRHSGLFICNLWSKLAVLATLCIL